MGKRGIKSTKVLSKQDKLKRDMLGIKLRLGRILVRYELDSSELRYLLKTKPLEGTKGKARQRLGILIKRMDRDSKEKKNLIISIIAKQAMMHVGRFESKI